jgi:hypothetical protein
MLNGPDNAWRLEGRYRFRGSGGRTWGFVSKSAHVITGTELTEQWSNQEEAK